MLQARCAITVLCEMLRGTFLRDGFGQIKTPDLKVDLIVTLEQPFQSITQIKLENSICADQNFFEFFDLPFIHGDRRKALSSAEAIVLSQRTSKSLFGTENPVGKVLRINAQTISGYRCV